MFYSFHKFKKYVWRKLTSAFDRRKFVLQKESLDIFEKFDTCFISLNFWPEVAATYWLLCSFKRFRGSLSCWTFKISCNKLGQSDKLKLVSMKRVSYVKRWNVCIKNSLKVTNSKALILVLVNFIQSYLFYRWRHVWEFL